MSSSGTVTLEEIAGKLPMLELACSRGSAILHLRHGSKSIVRPVSGQAAKRNSYEP